MNITIIGGGNIGTLMAAEFAHKGHEVTIYSSKPERFSKTIEVYYANEELVLKGTVSTITNSMETALSKADYIWVVMPAQLFRGLAEKMLPYVRIGQKIGIVPGSGGAEFAFYKLLEKGCTLFGLQRVHSIARLKVYGKSVYELGRKQEIQIGAIPVNQTSTICNEVSKLFDMPCIELENYLTVTLTPSNPILHTTRLYSMFKEHQEGDTYPRNFLFYEEWDDESSKILIACDEELQTLCNKIPLDLNAVVSLQDYYESHSVEAMTNKISSIKAFKGLTSPMKEVDGGWVPDWTSRYFTADFPFGLKIIKDLASLFDVKTPNIDIVWNWYETVAMEEGVSVFETDLDRSEFLNLYR